MLEIEAFIQSELSRGGYFREQIRFLFASWIWTFDSAQNYGANIHEHWTGTEFTLVSVHVIGHMTAKLLSNYGVAKFSVGFGTEVWYQESRKLVPLVLIMVVFRYPIGTRFFSHSNSAWWNFWSFLTPSSVNLRMSFLFEVYIVIFQNRTSVKFHLDHDHVLRTCVEINSFISE